MKKALIIFQKNPKKGSVKTRLAATVGDENALRIYNVLVSHTHEVIKQVDCDKYLYFSNQIEQSEKWGHCELRVQKGADLGERMYNAIAEIKMEGAEEVVIIGTDCYELLDTHINAAFLALERNDYCIGPAEDGGYYLMGTNSPDKGVFLEKEWSTESVFEEAKSSIDKLGKSLAVLDQLPDVDNEADLKSLVVYLK